MHLMHPLQYAHLQQQPWRPSRVGIIMLHVLKTQQVFVEEGCDATILNDEEVCAVSILRQESPRKFVQ